MNPRDVFVEANRLRHHLVEWDGGGETTVLCLHGFLDQAWSFQWFAEAMGVGRHVLALDLRGHGQTEWVGRGGYYHFADYLLDLAAIVPLVRRSRLVLVGHSLGGVVVLRYAGTIPDGLDAVVALEGLGPPEGSFDEGPSRAARTIEGLRDLDRIAPRVGPDLENIAARIRVAAPRLSPERALAIAPKAAHEVDGGWKFRFDPMHRTLSPTAFVRAAFEPYCRRVRVPALLVEGALSDFRLVDRDERVAWIEGARCAAIQDAGHMIHLECPEALARVVESFLADLGL